MNRRLIVLLLLLVGLLVLLPATLKLAPHSRRPARPSAPPADLPEYAPSVIQADHYDDVTVTISIPPKSEFPDMIAAGAGCPQKQLGHVLGVAVTPGQGCVVMEMDENGPAAKAGIKLGDRLGASPKDCPSSIAYHFTPRTAAREVTWTVQRPVLRSSSEKAPAEEPPS